MKRNAQHAPLFVSPRRIGLTALLALLSGCYARATVYPLPLPPPPPLAPASIARVDERMTQRTVESLIDDCVSRPWAQRFRAEQGRLPVVRVRPVINHAVPAASALAYTKELEMALVRSGRALVASGFVSAAVDAELADQSLNASDATRKHARPLGSDYVLSGWVAAEQREGDPRLVHVVTLQLVEVRSNEKVWISSRRILSA